MTITSILLIIGSTLLNTTDKNMLLLVLIKIGKIEIFSLHKKLCIAIFFLNIYIYIYIYGLFFEHFEKIKI
jgi:hypothetical protein